MNKGTIEINHSNFLLKLKILDNAMAELQTFDFVREINNTARDKFKYAQSTYNDVKNSYEMDVVGALTDYYEVEDSVVKKLDTPDTYGMRIVSNNYNGKLIQCMNFVEHICDHLMAEMGGRYEKTISILCTSVRNFKRSKISTHIKEIAYDICACGSKMKIYPTTSEIVCEACGESLKLYGTVFEDTQFYNQEGQHSKHGNYDPSRHCKFWVYRIQAKKNADIPKECTDAITYCIKRDGVKDARKLLCSQIRLYLKETHNTEYNDHVPLIRKIITGIAPPQLTCDELRMLYNLFDKAVNIYEMIKPPEKSNTMYYPYIIYKILDFNLPNNTRKRLILECIHLQRRDTLIANDNLWGEICKILIGLPYKPTDRNDQRIDW
jgi:hypothetical protein